MKKFMFILMVALVSGFSKSYAQNTLVATLTHGDEITMFYGADAFLNAHNAAVNGDVITLSGGKFNDITINKGVTIRGSGIDIASPSFIQTITINIPDDATNRLVMEGIQCGTLNLTKAFLQPYFLKCHFRLLHYKSKDITDVVFVNCKLIHSLIDGSGTVKMFHCIVLDHGNLMGSPAMSQFVNCMYRGYLEYSHRCSFTNCIIEDKSSGSLFPVETTVMNSLTITENTNPYEQMQASQIECSRVDKESFTTVFKYYKGDNDTDDETFELTDEAKTIYLGTDGTEIGLYGGQYPYDTTPRYPVITKMNVAKQTTTDDKLSVDIEVSATE